MGGIKDLAKYLNISTGTVSRALNNRPDVNEETRKRVKDAAELIGYMPNQSGRSLRQGTTNIIAFMFTTSRKVTEVSADLFMGIADGIQSVMTPHNLDLVVISRPQSGNVQETLHRIVSRRLFDGLILAQTDRDDPRIAYMHKTKMPFIALGRSDVPVDYTWCDLDFESAARQTVERLVAKGHRRIAICMPNTNLNWGYLYLNSYKETLARLGIPVSPELVMQMRGTEDSGEEAAERLMALTQPATAVLLAYDFLAQGLYKKLTCSGVKIGVDIAVIGVRDHPQNQLLAPKLTAFRVDGQSIGEILGYQMLANMPAFAEQYAAYRNNTLIPMHMIPGQSDDFTL